MIIVGHSSQCGHRFALASRCNDGQVAVRDIIDIPDVHKSRFRQVDISQILCNLHHVLHGTTGNRNFTAMMNGRFHKVLNSMNIRRERSDDNSFIRFLKNSVHGLRYDSFRRCEPRTEHVGTVTKKYIHALVAQFRKASQINLLSFQRSVIHLEISRMNDVSCRALDGERKRIRNAVGGVNCLHDEASYMNYIT